MGLAAAQEHTELSCCVWACDASAAGHGVRWVRCACLPDELVLLLALLLLTHGIVLLGRHHIQVHDVTKRCKDGTHLIRGVTPRQLCATDSVSSGSSSGSVSRGQVTAAVMHCSVLLQGMCS